MNLLVLWNVRKIENVGIEFGKNFQMIGDILRDVTPLLAFSIRDSAMIGVNWLYVEMVC